MISKEFRLNEREVGRALQKGKPFFAYNVVLNSLENKVDHNKFAIVVSGKSAKNSVIRNFYRRRFYNFAKKYINTKAKDSFLDLVIVVKTKFKLDLKNEEILNTFDRDVNFLLSKKFNNN